MSEANIICINPNNSEAINLCHLCNLCHLWTKKQMSVANKNRVQKTSKNERSDFRFWQGVASPCIENAKK